MPIDSTQIGFKVLLVFGITKFLRTYFETAHRNPTLEKYLKNAWIGTFLLCIILAYFSAKYSDSVFNYFLFSFVIFCTYKLNEPKISRTVLIAVLPLFISATIDNLIETIAPNFYHENRITFGSVVQFCKFWVLGFSVYAFMQTSKDRKLRQKELEELRLLEEQKHTLEYQVAQRTAEITQQKEELEKTIIELKTTQNQLVHAEKMASLGELTAGIAHEIQNPLNFVNNFSEVSSEICKEIETELNKDGFDKSLVLELFTDISNNQDKIAFHGKRAASIVKGMLQHSRKGSTEKELTDINNLADEYLRLSYHGLRAKDKSFNAEFTADLDKNLPKIKVIPQEIGRVLMNLINNAFQSPAPSKNSQNSTDQNKYIKKVTITTKLTPSSEGQGSVLITVKDNGNGIPKANLEKIFQPFFTTKPTGQGTGLGLSLAYDIVTKGHGGTIEVVSKEGEGAEFIVKLPI